MDEGELVAVALTLNPGLRATRAELGEAQALLIQAGLWPNPEVGVAVRPELGGGSTGFELDFLFALLRPGERKTKKSIAKATVEEARARYGIAGSARYPEVDYQVRAGYGELDEERRQQGECEGVEAAQRTDPHP